MERMCIGLLHLDFPIHLSNFRAKNTPKVGLLRPKTMHKHFLNNSKTSLKMSKLRLSKLKKARNDPSKRSKEQNFDLKSPFLCLFINLLSWKYTSTFFMERAHTGAPGARPPLRVLAGAVGAPGPQPPLQGVLDCFFLEGTPARGPRRVVFPMLTAWPWRSGPQRVPARSGTAEGPWDPKIWGHILGPVGPYPPYRFH